MNRLSRSIALLLFLVMAISVLSACTPKKNGGVETAGELTDWVTYQTTAAEMETFTIGKSTLFRTLIKRHLSKPFRCNGSTILLG